MAKHHIMVIATPLPGVRGRINYISNPEKQEHLVAVHESISDKTFWKELAEHCQDQAAKNSKSKHACEGREYIVMLANELSNLDPPDLSKKLSVKFKELTGTENVVALHWNKDMTNFHCHIVCAENQEVNETTYGAVLTRNTYYDENGKRSTKKACVDEDGNLKPGCRFYEKGSRLEHTKRFGTKVAKLSSKSFLQDVKTAMIDLQNELLHEERFKVFDRKDIYLAEQHVGKNKTQEQKEAILAKNKLVRDYKTYVDRLLDTAEKVSEERFYEVSETIKAARKEIKESNTIESWMDTLRKCIKQFKEMIDKLSRERMKMKKLGFDIFAHAKEVGKEVEKRKTTLDALIGSGMERTSKSKKIISADKETER